MKFISNTLDIAKFLDRKIKFNEVINSISTDMCIRDRKKTHYL